MHFQIGGKNTTMFALINISKIYRRVAFLDKFKPLVML